MKKLQQGRSMIEMLGVLAIIGVLSIGGLAGYTMAMNRHKANSIMDYVARCAVVSQTRGMGADEDLTATTCGALLVDEKAPVGEATAYAVGGATNGQFTIKTPALTEAVAKAIASRNAANGNPTIAADASNQVTFTFNPVTTTPSGG